MDVINAYGRQLSEEEIASGFHREFVGGFWQEMGELQFEFLCAHGMGRNHRVLDMGCGALRGGVHLVRYLNPGNYFGLDVNPSLIAAGEHELRQAGLNREHHLLVDDAFKASRFGEKFDYVIAVSLFTHLYANHIAHCLVEVAAVLNTRAAFFASFFEAPDSVHVTPIAHSGGITTRYDRDPFHYSAEEIRLIARLAGLRVEVIGDWNHPRGQHMARFYR